MKPEDDLNVTEKAHSLEEHKNVTLKINLVMNSSVESNRESTVGMPVHGV